MTAVGASAANDNDVLENAKLVRDVICFFFLQNMSQFLTT